MAKKLDEDGNVIEEEEEVDDDNDDDTDDDTDDSDSGSDGKDEQKLRDKIAGKARDEGRTVGQKSTLKELGITSLEEGKKLFKAMKDAEDAEKSELERLTDKIDGFEQRAKDAETLVETERKKSTLASMKSAVKLEIVSNSKLNVHSKALNDVWAVLEAEYLGDDGIHFDENGKIKGVAKSVESLLKAKPYFTSTPKKETPGSNTRYRRNRIGEGEPIDDGKPNPKYGKDKPNPRL